MAEFIHRPQGSLNPCFYDVKIFLHFVFRVQIKIAFCFVCVKKLPYRIEFYLKLQEKVYIPLTCNLQCFVALQLLYYVVCVLCYVKFQSFTMCFMFVMKFVI